MSDIEHFGRRAIRDLGLEAPVEKALLDIYGQIDDSYRGHFLELTKALQQQAAALDRIQKTLQILITAIKPDLAQTAPVAFGIAPPGAAPDVATLKLEVLDPIAGGFTLSQKDLATALGLEVPTVSVLVRAFRLPDDPECAMTVRRGNSKSIVNYRPHAATRFRELVKSPPAGLAQPALTALKAARKRLG